MVSPSISANLNLSSGLPPVGDGIRITGNLITGKNIYGIDEVDISHEYAIVHAGPLDQSYTSNTFGGKTCQILFAEPRFVEKVEEFIKIANEVYKCS